MPAEAPLELLRAFVLGRSGLRVDDRDQIRCETLSKSLSTYLNFFHHSGIDLIVARF
jgi:hypothetical protein